jgi:hypothetical protein
MRSFWHLLEPRSCKVKSESSESQSCCYAWFNTMIRTYKRNVQTPVSLSVFLFLGQFMMYPKWRWSTGRFNHIWLEAKYEDKFWWTYPFFFGLPTWTVWRDLVILLIFCQNLTKEDLPKKDFRTFYFFPCSQCVPKSTLVLFHMIFPKFNSHVYNLKRWAKGGYIFLYFVTGVQRGPSIGECSMFQKIWWWAYEYGSFKKKKEVMCTPMN